MRRKWFTSCSSARGTVCSATPGRRLGLFNNHADPKSLHVYTDTYWAADELTRKSVSCTLERCGSHMLDCSVAKQSLVARSFGEAEFYGIVSAVVTSKQTSQVLGTGRSASGGDHCIRTAVQREESARERDRERSGTFR